nr:MAG TPA: Transcriptional regulator FleQ factor, AAA+, ATPase, c-di-GMP [Caudoviricetes sp.]
MKTNKRLHIRLSKREQVSGFARFIGMSRQGLYKALKQEKRNLWALYVRWVNVMEIYMLGKKVYWLSFAEGRENVYDGVVIGASISDKGYRRYLIETAEGRVARESAYVFADKETAKAAFDIMLPIADKMVEIQKKAQEELDALRKQLLGEPEFSHLTGETHEKA